MIENIGPPHEAEQTSREGSHTKISGGVRTLQDADFSQIARLHDHCFRRSIYKDHDALQRQIRKLFRENPWRCPGIDSLVWEDGAGRVLGFAGLLARPMRFRGEPILSALSCQVMVDPEARGEGIAEALLRASTEGPQAITYSDILNPAAFAIWRRIGGSEIPELGLQWTRPLRPFRWLAARVGRGCGRVGAMCLARPVLSFLDAIVRSDPSSPYSIPIGEGQTLRPLSLINHLKLLDDLQSYYDLVPCYDEQSLTWLMGMLGDSLQRGTRLEGAQLVDRRGDTIGFFLMAVQPRAIATVLQIGTPAGKLEPVLAAIVQRANESQCAIIRGRHQPEHLSTLAKWPNSLGCGDPRVMVISRHPEIIECIRRGRAWMSHLEGEWCIGF